MEDLIKKFQDFNRRRQEIKDRIPSGILSFDLATNGGIPRSKITQVYDKGNSLGKTSVLLEYCKNDLNILYFDIENQINKQVLKNRKIENNNILISKCGSLKDILKCIENLETVDIIIIDSLCSIYEEGTQDNNPNIRYLMRILSQVIEERNSACILSNQVRGVKIVRPYGGIPTNSWVDTEIFLSPVCLLNKGLETIGRRIHMCINNGIESHIYLNLIFSKGFDRDRDILELGLITQTIKRRGTNYYYQDKMLGKGEEEASININEYNLLENIRGEILEKRIYQANFSS